MRRRDREREKDRGKESEKERERAVRKREREQWERDSSEKDGRGEESQISKNSNPKIEWIHTFLSCMMSSTMSKVFGNIAMETSTNPCRRIVHAIDTEREKWIKIRDSGMCIHLINRHVFTEKTLFPGQCQQIWQTPIFHRPCHAMLWYAMLCQPWCTTKIMYHSAESALIIHG